MCVCTGFCGICNRFVGSHIATYYKEAAFLFHSNILTLVVCLAVLLAAPVYAGKYKAMRLFVLVCMCPCS